MSDHEHICKSCNGHFWCEDCEDVDEYQRSCADCLESQVEALTAERDGAEAELKERSAQCDEYAARLKETAEELARLRTEEPTGLCWCQCHPDRETCARCLAVGGRVVVRGKWEQPGGGAAAIFGQMPDLPEEPAAVPVLASKVTLGDMTGVVDVYQTSGGPVGRTFGPDFHKPAQPALARATIGDALRALAERWEAGHGSPGRDTYRAECAAELRKVLDGEAAGDE
jgi:hypothetical protein